MSDQARQLSRGAGEMAQRAADIMTAHVAAQREAAPVRRAEEGRSAPREAEARAPERRVTTRREHAPPKNVKTTKKAGGAAPGRKKGGAYRVKR